ncbi:hypothetical protein BH09PSE2_BH09PSE2_11830 [soil metagenome]
MSDPPDVDALKAEIARLKRRVAELELLADRDPLTPLLNRRAFLRELLRAQAFQARYGGEWALAFLDLDGLKHINDTHGHAAGDAALQAVAQTLIDHVRETDVVGRIGGDEFAVLLSHAAPEAARVKAADLVAQIAAEPLVFEGKSIPLSASVGVQAVEKGVSPPELIAAADAAMYLNKRGR